MSWSVSYCGTPAEAKKHLGEQFDSSIAHTAHIEHESVGVALCERVVNNQLDFLIANRPEMKVLVTASGSAGLNPSGEGWKSYSQTSVSVNEYVDPDTIR